MRTGRLFAVGMVAAITLHFAQPAFAQATEDASEAGQAEPADQAETPAAKPAPAHKPKPAKPSQKAKHPAPAKPAAETTASGKPPVTSQDVRPPANILIDCAKAPTDAVTKLPTISRDGRPSTARSSAISSTPTTVISARFRIRACARRSAPPIWPARPASRATTPISRRSPITSFRRPRPTRSIALDPSVKRILVGKPLWRLELTAVGGNALSFLVIDPSAQILLGVPAGRRRVSASPPSM